MCVRGEAETAWVSLEEEKRGGLSRARPFSDAHGERMRDNGHKLQEGKFSWGKRRKFFTEWSNDGGRAWRSCGISLPADIQNLAVQTPEQRDLTQSSPEVTSNLIYSTILKNVSS